MSAENATDTLASGDIAETLPERTRIPWDVHATPMTLWDLNPGIHTPPIYIPVGEGTTVSHKEKDQALRAIGFGLDGRVISVSFSDSKNGKPTWYSIADFMDCLPEISKIQLPETVLQPVSETAKQNMRQLDIRKKIGMLLQREERAQEDISITMDDLQNFLETLDGLRMDVVIQELERAQFKIKTGLLTTTDRSVYLFIDAKDRLVAFVVPVKKGGTFGIEVLQNIVDLDDKRIKPLIRKPVCEYSNAVKMKLGEIKK